MLFLHVLVALGLGGFIAAHTLEDCLREKITPVRADLQIVGRRDADYWNATLINNAYTRMNLRPMVVLFPESTEDVQLIITSTHECQEFFPKSSGFSVLSGGHNYAGYCLSNGIVMNMQKMDEIYWDFPRRRVTVGMGVRWRHIYPHTQGTGLIPVGGGCPDVGVAGFTLGGGWSWLSREFGLGIDGLIEAQIVLANASVITLNGEIAQTSTDYADLWFAIRGAGGGNFGVVTQMTIALHELSSPVGLNGEVCWRLERAREAMLAYPAWLDSLPNEFGAPLIWSQMYGEQRYCVTVVYDGPPATGYELLAPMYALRPDYITLDENDLSNFEVVMDGHGAATNAPGRQYTHSLILPRENYTADFIDLVLAGVHRSPSVQGTVVFHEGGGVIDDVAWNATAFPYRDLFGVVQINAIWDSEDDDPENVNWADELYRELAPYAIGAYVNYMNGKLPAGTYNQLYYGPNLPRLQKVKNAVDPTNFFAYPAGLQATVLKSGRGEQEVRPTA